MISLVIGLVIASAVAFFVGIAIGQPVKCSTATRTKLMPDELGRKWLRKTDRYNVEKGGDR